MCIDIIVLRFTHLHFVLQHLSHWSDPFAITVGSNGIDIFRQQIGIFLFFKITLVIHQVVHRIQILGLQIFPGVLPCQLAILNVDHRFPYLIGFIQSIKNRNAQSQPQSIRTKPMIGRTGMEPMITFICVGSISPVPCQTKRRDIAISNHPFLPFSQFQLRLRELQFVEVLRQTG